MGVSRATYVTAPDFMVSVTVGWAQTFLTHCDSLVPRSMTVSVSVWLMPVAVASPLKTLTVNQGGLS